MTSVTREPDADNADVGKLSFIYVNYVLHFRKSVIFLLKGRFIVESKTKKLTECAVMVALASVLSLIKIYDAPYGGSVTLGSMVPLIVACVHIKDIRWGILMCFTFSLIQMMFGFAPPPTPTLWYFALVVLFDYVVAFTVLALANPISRLFKNGIVGAVVGAFGAVFARFICHFISGYFIWGVYAPEGQPVWLYSLLYNGGYLLPELVISTILTGAVCAVIFKKEK